MKKRDESSDFQTASGFFPSEEMIQSTNLYSFMKKHGFVDFASFQQWSHQKYTAFWESVITQLHIPFSTPPTQLVDTSNIYAPNWLPGAKMNIASACFQGEPNNAAILFANKPDQIHTMTYHALNVQSNQIAHWLKEQGCQKGDTIAIIMPMTLESVMTYLAILKIGGVVLSIADAFSATEIAIRLKIAPPKLLITQPIFYWDNKEFNLLNKIKEAISMSALPISIACHITANQTPINVFTENTITFTHLSTEFETVPCSPMDPCQVLFSSGTTGEPKAIVWHHVTPIKSASDAYFHHDIHPEDRLCWPTNLGWMMGPWLIFASLINRACISLYSDTPNKRAFGEFVQNAKISMLGVVPTLVANWRESTCMEHLDWTAIHCFSSTGECSNKTDMTYLMKLANHKPIIEYCGGTEIGGAYITSTLIQPNYPSTFSTPAMGSQFTLIDEEGNDATEIGEVAIHIPSIGLSNQLLNADHTKVYYEGMPLRSGTPLRRHGDLIHKHPNGYYTLLGRVDDTMNLGGIKTSAAEIERAYRNIPHLIESAAIAQSPTDGGPTQLIIYAVYKGNLDQSHLKNEMQQQINQNLNPLFKIYNLVLVESLPKTVSNKIIRRLLAH